MIPTPIILVCALVTFSPARSSDQGLQITDTTTYDQLDAVNQEPAKSEVGIAGGASVSSFNGNLMVSHDGSNSLPQDGNLPPLFFGLTYNSHDVRKYHVRTGTGTYSDLLSGRSWVGLGWTGHLGRVFLKSKYRESGGTWDYLYGERFFEFPDGSLYRFESSVVPAAPELKISYYRDCVGGAIRPCPPCNICQAHPYASCCECIPTDLCEGRENDPVEHYDVIFPDGTTYRLENIVASTSVGGWVKNEDRNGYRCASHPIRIQPVARPERKVCSKM